MFSVHDVRILTFSETPVAVLEHRGDPALVADSVQRFIDWRRMAGLHPRDHATFNILRGDPELPSVADYRIDLCVATDQAVQPNEAGVAAGIIPAGRCACLRIIGSTAGLRDAIRFLVAQWLPGSGEERDDRPVFVQRVSFPPDVPLAQSVTDIFLPLRGGALQFN